MALEGPLKITLARLWHLGQKCLPKRRYLTILYYHAVPERDAESFTAQMKFLARNAHCVFADCEELPQTDKPLIAVTFDDAFESVATRAIPIMEQLQIPATIYVPTGWLGRRPGWQMETADDAQEVVMDAERLQSILSPYVRLGSHSVDHPRLSQLGGAEQDRQFAESRAELERLTGSPIDTLAFPYGDFDEETARRGQRAGYRYLYTIMPQSIYGHDHGILRGRTAVEAQDSLALFNLKVNGAFGWMPAAVNLKRKLKSWVR